MLQDQMMRAGAIVSAGVVPVAGDAAAQEQWRFQITPYVWEPSLHGSVRPGPRLPEVDVSADVEMETTAITLAVGWSVVDRPEFVLDAMAGARIRSIDVTVDVPNRPGRTIPDRLPAPPAPAPVSGAASPHCPP